MNKEDKAKELLGRLAKMRINGEARQLLDALILSTGTEEAMILSNSQIGEITGLENDGIGRARTVLKKLNIVNSVNIETRKDKGLWSYRLQKDHFQWKVPAIRKRKKREKGIYGKILKVFGKTIGREKKTLLSKNI